MCGNQTTFGIGNQTVPNMTSSPQIIRRCAAPDCGQNASITVTKDMGGSKIYPATYEVVDDAGYTIWSGIVNFEANTCTAYELTL